MLREDKWVSVNGFAHCKAGLRDALVVKVGKSYEVIKSVRLAIGNVEW